MPIFEYEGINAKGENISGHVHGEALDIASRSLAGQGITVNKIGKVAGAVEESRLEPPGVPVPPPTEERSKFETRVVGQVIQVVPLQALQFFFSQLGTLLDAGINPADGLETLTKQTNSHKLIAIIRECKDHVIAGRPISVGLQRYPEVFSPLMLSMVRVGEEGGFLAEQCETLSEYIRREIELRNTIKRETATPKLTLAASVVIILGTNGLIQVVAPGGGQLPVPWFIWILAIIVGAGAFLLFPSWCALLPGVLACPGAARGFATSLRSGLRNAVHGLPGLGPGADRRTFERGGMGQCPGIGTLCGFGERPPGAMEHPGSPVVGR